MQNSFSISGDSILSILHGYSYLFDKKLKSALAGSAVEAKLEIFASG